MNQEYWATKDGLELVQAIKGKVEKYDKYLVETSIIDKCRATHRVYYSMREESWRLLKGGRKGEIIRIAANSFGAFINRIHTFTTQQKIQYSPMAMNTDFESLSQASLTKSVLEHYSSEGLYDRLSSLAERTILFSEYSLLTEWDEGLGQKLGYQEDGSAIRSGAVQFEHFSILDAIKDTSLRSQDQRKWVILRRSFDKYELAARYPKHREVILSQSEEFPKAYADIYPKIRNVSDKDTERCTAFHLFHEPTAALPEGREVLICGDVIIMSRPLGEDEKAFYTRIPVTTMQAKPIENCILSHTLAWDLLVLFQTQELLLSAQVTNALNTAITSFWVQSADGLSAKQLSEGMSLLSGGSGPPTPVNLAHNSPELYNVQNLMKGLAQEVSGLNDAALGNAGNMPNVKSGNALSLLTTAAITFVTSLQKAWVSAAEEVADTLIDVLQRNATVPQVIAISGKSKRTSAKDFVGSQISAIKRVTVTLSNPVLATLSGRIEVAGNLLQQGSITAKEYVAILETGSLDAFTQDDVDSELAILQDMDWLRDGHIPQMHVFEPHIQKIQAALKLIDSPEAKENLKLVEAVTAYVSKHVELWRQLTESAPDIADILQIPMPKPLQGPPPPPPSPLADLYPGEQLAAIANDPMTDPELKVKIWSEILKYTEPQVNKLDPNQRSSLPDPTPGGQAPKRASAPQSNPQAMQEIGQPSVPKLPSGSDPSAQDAFAQYTQK